MQLTPMQSDSDDVVQHDGSAIVELVEQYRDGLTFDELYRALADSGEGISHRNLRERLKLLTADGVVETAARPSDVGRPSTVYRSRTANSQMRLFDDSEIRTREEVESEFLPTEDRNRLTEEHGYLAEIGIDHLSRDRLVEAVRLSVPDLAQADPVELILDFADWTVNFLRNLRSQALSALARGARGEMEAPVREYEFVANAARNYFRDLFRLHRGLAEGERVFEVREVGYALDPSISDDQVVFFDRARAEPVLRSRIVGDRVIGIERELNHFGTPEQGTGFRVTTVATDASIIPIRVKTRPRGSYELPETLLIFAGAAAQVQTMGTGIARLVDHDLDQGFLATRDEVQAAEQGWMITEFIQEVIGEGHSKYAISAAQEFRQYRRDADVLLNRISWRGAPGLRSEPADVLVRDGRLFPLVHRLRDYEAGGLYGRIVRNEVQEFAEACRRALEDHDFLTYGAFVKQPVAYFLAPLVFWFCRCKLGMTDQVRERAIFRPPLGDSLLSYILLRQFLSNRDPEPQTFATTFRVLRRYTDLATTEELPRLPVAPTGYRLVREGDEEDWAAYLKHRREDRSRRWEERIEETPPIQEREYSALRFLGYRVGILMGFALPGDGRFVSSLPYRLPRVEVLVDLARSEEAWQSQFRRLLSAFTGPDSLVPDDDHPDGSSIQLIIPQACREAHRAAVFADDVHRREIERRLTDAVGAIERTIRKRNA